MRIIASALACAALSGCVETGMAVGPNAAIDLMRGSGAASVSANGTRSFRYVFHQSAGTDHAHHEAMIGQWASRADGCPRGYSIAKVETVQGMTVYSGPCR